MTIDYNKLPDAPPPEIREEMIDILMDFEEYKDDEYYEAIIKNLRGGFMVLVQGDKLSITKEGFNHVNSLLSKNLN